MNQEVVLVGANPIIRLFDGDRVTAFASLWQVDWSAHGSGTVLVLWHENAVHVIGENTALARWVADDFTRHFPEVAGLPWSESTVEARPVHVELDLASGLIASTDDVTIRISQPGAPKLFSTNTFDLGGVNHGLSLVIAHCAQGSIELAGVSLPGEPKAFVTTAEVWTRDRTDLPAETEPERQSGPADR